MCSGGHSSDHGALGAYHANQGRNIKSATVDCLIGQAHPGIRENLVLGISSDTDKVVDFNCSASGRGRSMATIMHPSVAYTQLFGAVAEGAAGDSFRARRHLLDHMKGDVRRARSELGSLENEKLDAHFELATAAFVGGLTNCVTIASGVGFPNFNITFTGLGIQTGKHPIGHALYDQQDVTGWEQSEKIRAFHFQLIARTMDKLKAIPEGDGTMLDNTVIVYLSDGAETHHSLCFEWPFVLIGNANGRLKAGRYLQFPDYGVNGHRTINAIHETLLHLAGISKGLFGTIAPNLDETMHRGPLEQLLA